MFITNKLFPIFASQDYTVKYAGSSALNIYRNFINDPQLNSTDINNRLGPDIGFVRNSNATYFNSGSAIFIANINEPRFNYSPYGVLEGLLIEEQKTNLIEYSDDFTSSTWTVTTSGLTITSNIATAPNDTETATLITNTSGFGFHVLSWTGTPVLDEGEPLSNADFYDRSIYIKKETARYIIFSVSPTVSGTASGQAAFEQVCNIFDFDTKQFIHFSVLNITVTPIKNDWYRVTFGRSSTNSQTNRFTIGISKGPNYEDTIFSTNENELSGVYIWGAQTELGLHTSYIPTSGAQTTRAGDNASIIKGRLTLLYNPSASTFFIKGKRNYISQSNTFATFTNSTQNNYWTITTSPTAFNTHTLTVYTTAFGASAIQTGEVLPNTTYTLSASLRDYDVVFYQNNSLVGNLTDIIVPPSTVFANRIDRFYLGRFNNESYLNGHIQEFGYWPTREPI